MLNSCIYISLYPWAEIMNNIYCICSEILHKRNDMKWGQPPIPIRNSQISHFDFLAKNIRFHFICICYTQHYIYYSAFAHTLLSICTECTVCNSAIKWESLFHSTAGAVQSAVVRPEPDRRKLPVGENQWSRFRVGGTGGSGGDLQYLHKI